MARRIRSGHVGAALTLAMCGLAGSACAAAGTAGSASPATLPAPLYAVGNIAVPMVDDSRATPADGPVPGHPGRTLRVEIFYPASGVPGSPLSEYGAPAHGGPFPLIVFSHGFGSSAAAYQALLVRWAAAGFVVAAPTFPLTSVTTPGGADLADYVNQPGDVSFVISQMLAASKSGQGPLAGSIDPSEIAAAGHSLGGVTTLGLVGDTCCRDQRVDAAVVISGDAISFPGGRAVAPSIPMLFVHGDADQVVPYASSIAAFDDARGPKGLLTLVGGGHGTPVDATAPAFVSVVRTTIDFFDLFLKGARPAAAALRRDGRIPGTRLTLALTPGSHHVHLPVPKSATGTLHASVTPSQGLVDGQQVVVSWRDYTPGVSVNILQCSTPVGGPQACSLGTGVIGTADPIGSGSVSFVVHTGPVGAGRCDAAHSCVVVVNQGGSSDVTASVLVPVTFAP